MDVAKYLEEHEKKDLLRLLTCGSVDDGKSTLIGRLLFDTNQIYADQLASLKTDSRLFGTTGDDFDPALLTDGLRAEREQGITIDVAYRYFSTDKRKFIIADTPGHEQYTRNMATGASGCDVAVIMVDARKGINEQTKRHSFIVSLLGIKHVVVAVNKMDLVDWDKEKFEAVKSGYLDFIPRLDFSDVSFVPMSALKGENVAVKSDKMAWYSGTCLLHIIENINITNSRNLVDLRLPVQSVIRPDQSFRGYAGKICSGVLSAGMEVVALPSKQKSKIKSISVYDKNLQVAFAPMSVVVTLEDEIDVSRGTVIAAPKNIPRKFDELDAMIIWMVEIESTIGSTLLLKNAASTVGASLAEIVYQVDVNTLSRTPAAPLKLNSIARARLTLHAPMYFDSYAKNKDFGSFILIDKLTNATVAAGMLIDRSYSDELSDEKVVTSKNIRSEASLVSSEARSQLAGHDAVTLWLTGLSGSGKSTVAKSLDKRLIEQNRLCFVLDGDNVRYGLNRDLGFSNRDRTENIRRIAEVAKLMNQAGVTVIAACISPFAEDRLMARDIIGAERFHDIYISTPLLDCERRDPKGLYKKARAGELVQFTGIDSPYEPPANPCLVIDTSQIEVESAVDLIGAYLAKLGDRFSKAART
jgi:bifunctional enzyme CysN/CysC